MLGLTFTFKYILKDNQFFSFSFNKLLKAVYGFCYNIACFMFWSFVHEACGVLAPRPGIKCIPPALKGLLPFGKVRQIYLWKGNFQIVV